MNILLLGPFTLQNAGDNAIARVALRLLAQTFPGAHLTMAIHDLTRANVPPTEAQLVGDMLSWITTLRPDRTFAVQRLKWLGYAALTVLLLCGWRLGHRPRRLWRDPAKQALWQAYAEADLVVANGGGYLQQDLPWTPWFIGSVLAWALALGFGKPLILLPQSVGPLPGWEQRWLVRWLVRHAALVLVRDPISLAYLQAIGARGNMQLCPDLAFAQTAAPLADLQAWLAAERVPWPPTAPWIGLTALDWAAQFRVFSAAQQAQYEATLAQVCAALLAEGCVILGVPQVCGPLAPHDDRVVLQRVRAQLPHPAGFIILQQQPSPEVLQALYAQLDLLLGTRMHSVIFALNSATPVVSIGYLPKTRGLLRWLAGEAWCHDIAQVKAQPLLGQIRQLRQERAMFVSSLQPPVTAFQRTLAQLPTLLYATWQQTPSVRLRPHA